MSTIPPEIPEGTHIPFSRPYIGDEEQKALATALQQDVLHGDGPISERVEQQLSDWLDIEHAFLTTSCTHALEMAMIVLGIGPGDEVIMPSFNFVSAASAAVLRGARPVFADILPETMNIDPEDAARKVTSRTRAIIPVHYAGIGCEMDALMTLAEAHDLYVVEDAAQGVDSHYKGSPLGTIGHIGCYSFHDTKNITCGEGGAFLTDNEEVAQRAEIVREKGTNRSSFMRGEVAKYTWLGKGSSYVLSDILAAVLEAQLARRQDIRSKRRIVWEGYRDALQPLEQAGTIRLPVVPAACRQNYHIFYFHVPAPELRDSALRSLRRNGIEATFHYVPLHDSPFGLELLADADPLPHTDRYSRTIVRLPIYPQLAERIDTIARRVAEVVHNAVHAASAA